MLAFISFIMAAAVGEESARRRPHLTAPAVVLASATTAG